VLQAKIRMGEAVSRDARLRRAIEVLRNNISSSYDGAKRSNDGSCRTVCSKAAHEC